LLGEGTNRAKEAETLQSAALAERKAGRGDADPDRGLVQAHSTLAQALKMQSRLGEAVAHFEVAYTLCKDTPDLGGPQGPNTLAAASNLASALQELGRTAEAGGLHRLAAVGLQRALGPEHPNAVAARRNYEQFLEEAGEV